MGEYKLLKVAQLILQTVTDRYLHNKAVIVAKNSLRFVTDRHIRVNVYRVAHIRLQIYAIGTFLLVQCVQSRVLFWSSKRPYSTPALLFSANDFAEMKYRLRKYNFSSEPHLISKFLKSHLN